MKNLIDACKALFLLIICVIMVNCDVNVDSSVNANGSNDPVDSTDFIAKETFSHTMKFGSHTRFRIEGINGNISMTGASNSDTIVIAGEKRVGSDSAADAENHLQYLDVTVQDLTHEVYVFTTQPQQSEGRDYTVDYIIILPKNLGVTVNTVNGDVTIVSIENFLTVETINGTVNVRDIYGDVSVNLTNGNIVGDVTIPDNGTLTMGLVNGSIDLAIPRSTSAAITAQVSNGSISTTDLDIKNQTVSQNSLNGTLGNGQGTVSLSTINGTIYVSGK